MSTLDQLASAVGLAREWIDAVGTPHRVTDEVLVTILNALGYPAQSEQGIAQSLQKYRGEQLRIPPLITAEYGLAAPLPLPLRNTQIAEVRLESGARLTLYPEHGLLSPILEYGYHTIEIDRYSFTIAVCPPHCFSFGDLGPQRMWGPAVQIPALRDNRDSPFGSFRELAEATRLFAAYGADAIGISPVHALLPGPVTHFSPYSPSSRRFLNVSLANPASAGLPPYPATPAQPLIDWRTAMPERDAQMHQWYDALPPHHRVKAGEWARQQGNSLQNHSIFNVLHGNFNTSWQDWPAAFQAPDNRTVHEFASRHADEVAFHQFAQWLAHTSLDACQNAARTSGMTLGLIGDLAVGIDPHGSDAWAMQGQMLSGLFIGAPPDPLGPEGQNWHLTTFSPLGLILSGFRSWLDMIRAMLKYFGAIRIDHAFGLARLWVIPEGRPAHDGAYLTYPFVDTLRLLALESHRAKAVILAEDLGTSPAGFAKTIGRRNLAGLRVLQFEHDFSRYLPQTVAMTGTHDTPTVAGWWQARDLDWQARLGRFQTAQEQEERVEQRVKERETLWNRIGNGAPEPAPENPGPAVEQALGEVAKTRSQLAIFPLEDILALKEQPNIPGTIDEHPNWRRRLPAPLSDMLQIDDTQSRLSIIQAGRGNTD